MEEIKTTEQTESFPFEENNNLDIKVYPSANEPAFVNEDFISDAELKTIMYQYNPLAMRDIHNIEKGVENFFKFNQAHYALFKSENLTSLLTEDINFLETKKVLKTYNYIEYNKDIHAISVKKVIIRPASLKADQANKAIQSCIIGSTIALLQYINNRDKVITNFQEKDELKDWVFGKFIVDQYGNLIDFSDKKNLPRLLKAIGNFSFEVEIEKLISLASEKFAPIMSLLTKKNFELFEILANHPEFHEDAAEALKSRSDLPILTRFTPDFHLIQPAFAELVNITGDNFKEINSETDYIYFIFVELARKILISILPEEESTWIDKSGLNQSQRFYDELKKHKSFTNWVNAEDFLFIFNKLTADYERSKKLRNDSRLDYIVNENLKNLNMRFNVYNLNLENVIIDDIILKSFGNNREEVFSAIVEKIKQNRNIIYRKSKKEKFELTNGLTMIFKENIPLAFIKSKNIRNLLNVIVKQNGFSAGIYDFLIPVTPEDPKDLVNQQIALSKAIDEWIAETEKENIKKQNALKSPVVRFIEFILSLFGFKINTPVNSHPIFNNDLPEESKILEISNAEEKKKSIGVLVGPKEKKILIPAKVQKAIEYVERSNKGLIWVDEVLHAIGTPQYSANEIGDMLYYDQNRRYMEIRSLNSIRHVFIAREKETDPKWISSTIDYLDNMASGKKEYKILSTLLKNKDNN